MAMKKRDLEPGMRASYMSRRQDWSTIGIITAHILSCRSGWSHQEKWKSFEIKVEENTMHVNGAEEEREESMLQIQGTVIIALCPAVG